MVRNKTMCTLLLLVALIGGAPSASVSAGSAVIMTPQNAAMTLTVTKFTDSADGRCDADCSLREAITVANQAPGADTITLLPGTYQLTVPLPMSGENTEEEDEIGIGDLDIAGELHLRGAGAEAAVLTNLVNDRVLEILPGALVRINDLTITGGDSDHDGGGLYNSGDLTLTNVKVVANRAGSYEAGGAGGGPQPAGQPAAWPPPGPPRAAPCRTLRRV